MTSRRVPEGRGRVGDRIARRATWLLAGKFVQMGAGFLFWIVVARNAEVHHVGLAAATASGVILCTQLAILGAGSAVIVALGRDEDPHQVLDAALTLVLAAALVASVVYVSVAITLGTAGDSPAHTVVLALVLLVAVTTGTAIICVDQASVALHHAEGSVLRYACGGAISLTAVVALSLSPVQLEATVLVACWSLGALVACVLGACQLDKWLGYRYRPTLQLRPLARVIRRGLPNHALTMTERLPPALIPLLLAFVASPVTTAYWYPAWMMAWIVFMASVNAGLVQFADAVRHPEHLRRIVLKGFTTSLVLGGTAAVFLGVFAEQALGLLGQEYAAASATALRVLVLGVVPFAVVQTYFAICRATDHVREACVLGSLCALAICAGTVITGQSGPTAVALVWVGSTSVAALWAARRLRTLTFAPGDGPAPRLYSPEAASGLQHG